MAFYLATGFQAIEDVATPLGSGTRMRLSI
jgi:hypothetical protein